MKYPVFIAFLPVHRSNKPFCLFSAGFGLKNYICVSSRCTFAACNFIKQRKWKLKFVRIAVCR
jgi:hypothetical protein